MQHPTLSEQANALTPGDWSTMRDLLREMCAAIDDIQCRLNATLVETPKEPED